MKISYWITIHFLDSYFTHDKSRYIFGGVSREREISFAGAKTVFQVLDRSLFEPVFIFVDGLGSFIKINPKQLQHERISHFFPPQDDIPTSYDGFSPVYIETLNLTKENYLKVKEKVGTPIPADNLKEYIDFAMILMHGTFAEDGMLQGLFEWLQIPYSGCGIFSSAFSIDKHLQQVVNEKMNLGNKRPYFMLRRNEWINCNREEIFEHVKSKVGFPFVVKAPYQGSSIGVSILKKNDVQAFSKAVNAALFAREIRKEEWINASLAFKKQYVNELMSLEKGIGMPVILEDKSILGGNLGEQIYYSPLDLIEKLDDFFSYADENAMLYSFESEDMILFEGFLSGKEFSCGVIQTENLQAVALPPTEIITMSNNYDFEAKYLPSGSQKRIPINIPTEKIIKIQERCKAIFQDFKFEVCARIDGFFTNEGTIELIDINTIPGMSPTSLIFRQAAEIGLSPTNFLTYFVYQSLNARVHTTKRPYFVRKLFNQLRADIEEQKQADKETLAIVFDAQHLEQARHRFNIISSEANERPFVVFIHQNEVYRLPISFLLKPSIEEIIDNLNKPLHPALAHTITQAQPIISFFVTDFVSIPERLSIEKLVDMNAEILWLASNHDHKKLKMQLGEVGLKIIE